MADERDLIRSRIDIVELIGQRVNLRKSGKSWKGLCPFHDDTNPSFDVSPESGYYRCWSCGAKGDVFNWVMQTENVDFAEALRILAVQAGVELQRRDRREPSVVEAQEAAMAEAQAFFREQLTKSSAAQEYCAGRGLATDVLDHWEIGYAPDVMGALATHLQKQGHRLAECEKLFLVKGDAGGYDDRFKGRLMFPIRDERGRLVAFGGRVIGDAIPKYINSGDTPLYSKSRVLYGMNFAKESMAKERRAVLVEGFLDVIACHRAGVTNAVASLGTSLAEDHVRLLKRWCDEVVVLYDSDAAGQKAAERACDLLREGGLRVRVALVPQGKDPDTLLRQQGAEAVRKMVEAPLSESAYLLAQLESRVSIDKEEFWDEAAKILARNKKHHEIVGLVDLLAPRYPFTKDQSVARREIERSVRAERSKLRGGGSSSKVQHALRRTGLKGAEAAIIKAILIPELRTEAVAACKESDLFVSAIGRQLAQAVAEEFAQKVPTGAPSTWLPNVHSEELRETLMDLEREVLPHRDLLPLERQTFDEAVARLEGELEERKLDGMRAEALVDLDANRALLERLRAAKGVGPEPPTS
ncbi:MAG: DNA primase [Armatimonadetes bacterium]|nr:DNA primase [Armatimonadota bacterium]